MFTKVISAAALALTCLAGSASAEAIVCDFTRTGDKGRMNFVFSPVFLLFSEERKSVQVIDPLILYAGHNGINGKIRIKAKGTKVSWLVPDAPVFGGEKVRIHYSVTLSKDSKSAVLQGRIDDAINRISGKGVCKEVSKSELRKMMPKKK